MLKVYHGSTAIVSEPLALIGRMNLDFGQGFYVTDIRQQAVTWATRFINREHPQWLNCYELDVERIKQVYHCLAFEAYDQAWLDFIIDSRRGGCPWKDYDFIEGGVADDRVIIAVEQYLRGEIDASKALGMLAYHKPNNQICLLNQQLIDECLHFINAEALNELATTSEEGGIIC